MIADEMIANWASEIGLAKAMAERPQEVIEAAKAALALAETLARLDAPSPGPSFAR